MYNLSKQKWLVGISESQELELFIQKKKKTQQRGWLQFKKLKKKEFGNTIFKSYQESGAGYTDQKWL